jgi:hypothetical protein
MGGHGEKGIAFLILLAIGLYLAFSKAFSVSTSVAGVPTSQSSSVQTLNAGNVSSFTPVASTPYGTTGPTLAQASTPPDVTSGYAPTPFPFAYSTPDTSGLSADNHLAIVNAGHFV